MAVPIDTSSKEKVLPIAHPPLEKRAVPLPPSEDPFYVPPEGWEGENLGAILRYRETPNPPGFTIIKFNLQKTYQILYKTSDSNNNPRATVTTVFVPQNADFTKVLSYQTFQDSSCWDCSPSYTIQFQSDSSGAIIAQTEFLMMEVALDQGWIVITPDYEGPEAAFTAGHMAGHGVLDSLRAVLQSQDITGVQSDATVTLWGYSGGSLASGWAAELQPSYYPELEIAGTAVGGFVTNITAVALAVNSGPFVGLVPAGLMGLASEYPKFNETIQEYLKPNSVSTFESVKNMCMTDYILPFFDQDLYSKYLVNGTDVFYNPVIHEVLEENAMTDANLPKSPFFIYHAKNDEVAPVSQAERVYNSFCAKGVNIEFREDLAAEHLTETLFGMGDALSWLNDRMNGRAVQSGCTKTTVLSNALNIESFEILGTAAIDVILSILGAPIGPTGWF
ncbi:hypothetical protein TRVA0_040S00738 [Trichomonascus vanleenenianus]|uniref:uncharacterized protein n=1 Tax=Trichomonascus vanleenenianus TaxID=2268995 RepID=UPI003EC9DBAC